MKFKKGYTLVEVLVSISVFTLIFSTILLGVSLVNKRANQRYEKMNFINICYQINEYYDYYNLDWEREYFEVNPIENGNVKVVYYTLDYTQTQDEDEFRIEYYYDQSNNLIVSVYKKDYQKPIIDKLNYGSN